MVALDPVPSEYNRLTGDQVPDHVLQFKANFEERLKAGLGAVPQ